MSARNFAHSLHVGNLGERLIEQFLQSHGFYTIPSYDYHGDDNKAPKLRCLKHSYVVPDLDASKDGNRIWVEVKTYSTSPENRRLNEKVHGIKRRHFEHYKKVCEETGCNLFLFVLEADTGNLLVTNPFMIVHHSCMCRACLSGDTLSCRAPVKDSVYFLRKNFAIYHTFSSQEMAEIRNQLGIFSEVAT